MRGTSFKIVVVTVFVLPLAACSTSREVSYRPPRPITVPRELANSSESDARFLSSAEPMRLLRPGTSALGALPFVRSKPEAVPPFPIVLNRTVESYVDEYMAQPQGLEQSFRRSRPYMPEMLSVLQNEGLPRELVYLAFAESGFSKHGAGPWQLNKSTAREYGLVINRWIDERRDPIKSTTAAAEYLETLHNETGADWRMTLVAWNNGQSAANRYLQLEDVTYDRLMIRLPQRTRSLMNRFMAVALIARHAKEYGIQKDDSTASPHYRVLPVTGGTTLREIAQDSDTAIAALRLLNPALLHDRTPPTVDTYPVRIPDDWLETSLISDEF
jgi:membrane-bound lytic murein transglycosylase D